MERNGVRSCAWEKYVDGSEGKKVAVLAPGSASAGKEGFDLYVPGKPSCSLTGAHHAQAGGAGAEIVMPPRDQDFDGRGTIRRDPEGHVWSFGSYDPRV